MTDDTDDSNYGDGVNDGYSRRKRHERWTLLALLYGTVGLLTFAQVYENSPLLPYEAAEKNIGSVIAGVAWPVYWGGRGALWVVRTAQPKPVKEGGAPASVVVDLFSIPFGSHRCINAWGKMWRPVNGVCDAATRDTTDGGTTPSGPVIGRNLIEGRPPPGCPTVATTLSTAAATTSSTQMICTTSDGVCCLSTSK